jgi:hypothetical protein
MYGYKGNRTALGGFHGGGPPGGWHGDEPERESGSGGDDSSRTHGLIRANIPRHAIGLRSRSSDPFNRHHSSKHINLLETKDKINVNLINSKGGIYYLTYVH